MPLNELEIPPDVIGMEDPDEILRFWIAEGDSFVNLRINSLKDDLTAWGMIQADIAMHVARAHGQSSGIAQQEVLREIEDGYRGRMSEKFELSGRLLSGNN